MKKFLAILLDTGAMSCLTWDNFEFWIVSAESKEAARADAERFYAKNGYVLADVAEYNEDRDTYSVSDEFGRRYGAMFREQP